MTDRADDELTIMSRPDSSPLRQDQASSRTSTEGETAPLPSTAKLPDYIILGPLADSKMSPVHRFYTVDDGGDNTTKLCIQRGCTYKTMIQKSCDLASHLQHKHPSAFAEFERLVKDRKEKSTPPPFKRTSEAKIMHTSIPAKVQKMIVETSKYGHEDPEQVRAERKMAAAFAANGYSLLSAESATFVGSIASVEQTHKHQCGANGNRVHHPHEPSID